MIMIVKTPGSQKGSPAVAEEEAEAEGRGDTGVHRRRHSRVHQPPRCQHRSQMRDGEPRGSERRYDTMLGFASAGCVDLVESLF